ncbi:hypothetical protein UFOVP1666_5 [uncultured Caudovirales phage]|uniref:Uncharacterized protein n=1 Tax=uncultured Caudovirales phage TaxID=2100421 RepID=A0A6J5Q6K2_9CAUD|nr:hypothetical protein UFOVP867_158 [uncultured Caudovirales phage]CAB4170510.1 hypothetical protein UFOVP913_40 [uncultured Caudovirales phage]CAB4176945.1 hypothetical protein UFOVP993_93 [uncultured Caudovirales phage]CAB4222941.1 hypothetical protein UFOVP1666_5 [uncultured Caudovirales phage]
MTKDEIIEMLRESCDKDKVDPLQNDFWVVDTEELETFAKKVAEKEREACAKVCDDMSGEGIITWYAKECAKEIRARGEE